MPQNLLDAHRQWATRPPDERFPTLEALQRYTADRKLASREHLRPVSAVKLVSSAEGGLLVNGQQEPSLLTNWSFGQIASIVGAPARYLRTLPPEMVTDCLHYGLTHTPTDCKLLVREPVDTNGGYREPTAAAFTSSTYGRIWDADVVDALVNVTAGTGWRVPRGNPKDGSDNAGLYASDRDVFVFFINDELPIEVEGARLSRGFFCWNSETGSTSFGLTTFLYNHVCGNHIVWGAEQVTELRIIHRTHAFDRFYREALPMLNAFVESRTASEAILNTVVEAANNRIGETVEDVLKWFKDRPFSQTEVRQAYESGLGESQDVSTVWGMVQGFTSVARRLNHADRKVDLERRAGALLKAVA